MSRSVTLIDATALVREIVTQPDNAMAIAVLASLNRADAVAMCAQLVALLRISAELTEVPIEELLETVTLYEQVMETGKRLGRES